MNARILIYALMALALMTVSPLKAQNHNGTGFHLPVGVTFTQGAINVNDKLEDGFNSQGFDLDSFAWPFGVSASPYYDFKLGPGNLGIGGSVGPIFGGAVDINNDDNFDEDIDKWFLIIPVGADLRYTFFPDRNISPYVRGGFRYPIALGDLVDDGKIGPFGAVGVEFNRTRRIYFGFEVAYDSSEVEITVGTFRSETISGGMQVTGFVGFSF